MCIFKLLCRTLVLSAVVVAMSVGLMGCPDTPLEPEPDVPIVNNPNTFTDSRDGKKYRSVNIGKQTWMAENLNYVTGESWCYENSPDSCAKYGRLYLWEKALSVCPNGWHLPYSDEWDSLAQTVGGTLSPNSEVEHSWLGTGKKLKFGSGWRDDGNGTDIYGFSAMPGGSFNRMSDNFYDNGKYGVWWTATDVDESSAYYWILWYFNDDLGKTIYRKNDGRSVRCVKDK